MTSAMLTSTLPEEMQQVMDKLPDAAFAEVHHHTKSGGTNLILNSQGVGRLPTLTEVAFGF